MKAPKTKIFELFQEWPGALHYGEEKMAAVARGIRAGFPFRFYGIDFQHESGQFKKEFFLIIMTL